MGHRLSRIVTRTGDSGTTGLGDGSRVPKDSARIEAIGGVDELNSSVGVVLAETLPAPIQSLLTDIQHDLFDLGGELSIPGHTAVTPAHIEDEIVRVHKERLGRWGAKKIRAHLAGQGLAVPAVSTVHEF